MFIKTCVVSFNVNCYYFFHDHTLEAEMLRLFLVGLTTQLVKEAALNQVFRGKKVVYF